jgi:hypothetical protein
MDHRRTFARRLLFSMILAGGVLALYSQPGLWSGITQAIGDFSLSYPNMDALADTMWSRGAELLKSMVGLMVVLGLLEQYSNGGLFKSQPRAQQGPREENFARGGAGAAMLVLAAYLLIAGGQFLGVGYLGLVSVLLRAPFEHPAWVVLLPLVGWAVLLGAGLLSLCVGINRSRGRRDAKVAVPAACQAAIGAALLWLDAFLPTEWKVTNIALGGGYLWALVAGSTRLYLAMRGLPAVQAQPFGRPPAPRPGGGQHAGRRPA